jgi:very-short-patch-repair endonuclease
MAAVDPVEALRALGGTARWKQLVGHVARRALVRAVASGQVARVRGTYSLPTGERAPALAVLLRATRSHATAAEHWGWSLPPDRPATVRLTVPFKARRTRPASDVRLRYRDLPPTAVVGDVTTKLQTVVDCLRDESLRVALSVGDSALRARDVRRPELLAAVDALRGPGSAVARTRARLLDGRAANAFESCARAILIEAGIIGFEPQVSIRHRNVYIGRVDLADRARRIVVECDGFEFHGTLEAMTRDCTRHTWLVSAGWRPLRLTWYQVMFEPEWVLERVRDTIAEAERAGIAVQRRRKVQDTAA